MKKIFQSIKYSAYRSGLKPGGHSDYQTTRNIYTHLSEKHLEQAKQEMEKMFKNKVANPPSMPKTFKV